MAYFCIFLHRPMVDILCVEVITVNVDIFALYIFSRNSRFLDMRENMYPSKITLIIAYRGSCT